MDWSNSNFTQIIDSVKTIIPIFLTFILSPFVILFSLHFGKKLIILFFNDSDKIENIQKYSDNIRKNSLL